MNTFTVHETVKLWKGGMRTYYARVYCACGGLMVLRTDSPVLYDCAIQAFVDAHQSPECGDTSPPLCYHARLRESARRRRMERE